MTTRELFRELLSTFPGKAGLTLLAVLVLLSIVALAIFPLNWGKKEWSDPARWADNPKAAPPVWATWLPGVHRAPHRVLKASAPSEVDPGETSTLVFYRMTATFGSRPPSFLSFSLRDMTFAERPPQLAVSVRRPDGTEAVLLRPVVRAAREDEQPPYHRFHEEPLRIVLTSEGPVVTALADFYRQAYGASPDLQVLRDQTSLAIFGEPDPASPGRLRPLPGAYTFQVRALLSDPNDSAGAVQVVAGGGAYGLMGTDALGRDLAQALLFGLPVALLIGVAASLVTTAIGTSLGVLSGYVGGKTDLVIQRLTDVVNNVTLLPLLIFFVFVVGSHLYLIILFLVAFSWPGLTILVRSMVLQVRSGQLVEAAVTMGASKWRIMRRHVFPSMAPFVFAQMIFFAPAAILAESGLSFLGLGDPSIPTWGQILESGFRTGAVYLGYWWWVIPPGLLIIVTAVTFMFLALAMEPVVNPRLRRVR